MSYTGSTPDTEPAPNWRKDALCARPDMTPLRDLFFPLPGEKAKSRQAKQICAACPVRNECLDDALNVEGGCGHEKRHGIRGGLSPDGRRKRYERRLADRKQDDGQPEPDPPKPKPVRRKQEPAKCGTRAGYQKHLQEKTETCPSCRRANTDADNRLRRTGTTKALA